MNNVALSHQGSPHPNARPKYTNDTAYSAQEGCGAGRMAAACIRHWPHLQSGSTTRTTLLSYTITLCRTMQCMGRGTTAALAWLARCQRPKGKCTQHPQTSQLDDPHHTHPHCYKCNTALQLGWVGELCSVSAATGRQQKRPVLAHDHAALRTQHGLWCGGGCYMG